MSEITMPRLSDSMEEGTILTWLKRDGDRVEAGDELVEIETDKATMTYEADAAGVLTIVAQAGETLAVGAPMARVGEAAASAASAASAAPVPVAVASGGAALDRAPAAGSDRSLPGGAELADPAIAVVPNGHRPSAATPNGVKATPLARRIAQAHGVELSQVTGSGPKGRITRADVAEHAGLAEPSPLPTPAPAASAGPVSAAAAAAAAPAAAAPLTSPPPPSSSAKGDVEIVELTRLQQVVARRMVETKATVPEFQVQTDVAMDEAIAFRAQAKAVGAAISFNDLVVKAAALALRKHPRANGSYRDGHFELYSRVNVGVAVAAQDALVVPTVFDADAKALGAIAADTRRLAQRVRDGQVTPPELSGATFTVSNLGMYGMTAIAPVINAPQAAILGVGSLRAVPAVVDGALAERHLMTLTLTCDHRILYGADAAEFLSTIRELLEHPFLLAL